LIKQRPHAYNGTDKFAFVSYAHNDSGTVYPIIEHCNRRGLHLWYDDGIKPGRNFSQVIAAHIMHCSVFLLFLSRNSAASQYVHSEIMFAQQCRKEIIVVLLDDISVHSRLPATIISIIPRSDQFISLAHGQIYAVSKISEVVADFCDGVISPFIGKQKGQTVLFGHYFSDRNISPPIEWLIACINNDIGVIISKYILDAKAYHDGQSHSDWQSSSLRKWLNNDFFNTAFSQSEQALILPIVNANESNMKFGTPGGQETEDRIFCLSESQTRSMFINSSSLSAFPTEHARNRGVSCDDFGAEWWLRSPGIHDAAATVHSTGYINTYGTLQNDHTIGVRPAFIVYI